MRIFIGIFINALLLFLLSQFLPCHPEGNAGICVVGGWKAFLLGGVILGILNTTIRPILNILSLPIRIITLGAFSLVINGIILVLFEKILLLLKVPMIEYSIHGFGQFVIAVAIFTLFNTISSIFIR